MIYCKNCQENIIGENTKVCPYCKCDEFEDDSGFDVDCHGDRLDTDHNMWLKQDLGIE